MVGFMRGFVPTLPPPELPTRRSFRTALPHHLPLDADLGICLLVQTRTRTPDLALGCAWNLEPRNVEVVDEGVLKEMARWHESLLKGLPIGAALQGIMTILPVHQMPAWEAQHPLREGDALSQAQYHAIRQGFPHQSGTVLGRLKQVRTLVTFRLPLPRLEAQVMQTIQTLLESPRVAQTALAETLARAFAVTLRQFRGYRELIQDTLRAAGHTVEALDYVYLGQAVAQVLDPLQETPPFISASLPLKAQVLQRYPKRITNGWQLGWPDAETGRFVPQLTGQLLSLHRAMPRSYPGILCAPRAPKNTTPLALWNVWPGPLTVAVNIAIADTEAARRSLKWKQKVARKQADRSVENKAIAEELDVLLEEAFLGGTQYHWGRVHIVLWEEAAGDGLAQGLQQVQNRARLLELEFQPEPDLGSTLLLQTLPLGFDPEYPSERFVQRGRQLAGAQWGNLLPFYGAMRGTRTPAIAFLNQRGEVVYFSPFDQVANAHGIITGMPGAGKSFNVAYMINQLLDGGAWVVVLDQLPSYKELCAVHDGTYIQLSYDDPICFNPFYGSLDKEHQAFITAVLLEMASGDEERVGQQARGVLGDAVGYFAQTWDRAKGEPTLSDFIEGTLRAGTFTDDEESHRIAKELCRRMNMFYGNGGYAPFTDGRNTLRITKALTIIEQSELEEAPDLKGILFFAIMHLLTEFYTDPEKLLIPKYFFSDENWSALQTPATARVIVRISRTFRKLNTSAWFLSQLGEDFNSPAGRILRANARLRMFLMQAADERDIAADLFKLSATEVGLYEQVQRHDLWSTAYLQMPQGTGGMLRIVPDLFVRLTVSQHPRDRARRDAALTAHGGDMRAAITALVQEELAHA